jgi:hypothetical protein
LHGKRLGWTAELSRSARLVFGHERDNLILLTDEKTIGSNDQRSDPTLGHCSETAVNLPLVAAGKDDEL